MQIYIFILCILLTLQGKFAQMQFMSPKGCLAVGAKLYCRKAVGMCSPAK